MGNPPDRAKVDTHIEAHIDTEIDSQIDAAVATRKNGQFTEALAILLDLLKTNTRHARLHFEIASSYDSQGLEADAIPFYEQAIELGLGGENQRGALLGLGSSYRCVEQYADAVRTFERGIAAFPEAAEFPVFLAMALHNLGDNRRALQLLLRHIAAHTAHPGTACYQRAIYYYADHPDPADTTEAT